MARRARVRRVLRGRRPRVRRLSVPDLLIITDVAAARAMGRGVVETVARALSLAPSLRSRSHAHARCAVLVRYHPGASLHAVRDACAAIAAVATRASAQVLVHTHAELVEELGLDGVHLSSSDATPAHIAAVRALLPAGALLGASRHAGDASDAYMGLDYATISPVFAPASKPHDTRATLGLDGLHRACTLTKVPLLALGGVDEDSARACRIVGAHGVAVLGRVMSAHDPAHATQTVLRAVRASLPSSP